MQTKWKGEKLLLKYEQDEMPYKSLFCASSKYMNRLKVLVFLIGNIATWFLSVCLINTIDMS